MRLLVLCFALLSSGLLVAQNNSIEVYPWNPDANNDNSIGATDILSTLAVYGNEFGLPPDSCDYDGTPIEEWWSQLITGDVILDSIFIEFTLIDSSLVYYPGCPEPTLEAVQYSHNEMLTSIQWATSPWPSGFLAGQYLQVASDYNLILGFFFNGALGRYHIFTRFQTLNELGFTGDGLFGSAGWSYSSELTIPFPTGIILEDDGLHFDGIWDYYQWPFYAEYIHILPYWHYAD